MSSEQKMCVRCIGIIEMVDDYAFLGMNGSNEANYICESCYREITEVKIAASTPTPPDSQVVKYFLDVLKYAIDESTQPHHARTRIKDAIDYAESQLASPETENPTVARGLIGRLKDKMYYLEQIEHKHSSIPLIIGDIKDDIAQAESQLAVMKELQEGREILKAESQLTEPAKEYKCVNCKIIYRAICDDCLDEEEPYTVKTRLIEPKVLEFELRPHSEYEGYKAFLCTKLQYGGCPLFEDNFATKEQAEEAANAIATRLSMVAKIKEVEDGDS